MDFKKRIAVILSLVLSIQMLPMQQIAAWFSSNQATEEIAHTSLSVKGKSGVEETETPFQFHNCSLDLISLLSVSGTSHLRDEDLLLRHADDILTPPPNC